MKKKGSDKIIRRLVQEARPIWHWLVIGAVLNIFAVLCMVAAPNILGRLVQLLIDAANVSMEGTLRNKVLPGACVLLLVYVVGSVMSYMNMWLMNNMVSRYFSCGLRIRISEKIKHLPVRYVDQTPVGDILSRMTGDVSEMGGYIHQIFDILIKGFFQIVLIAVAMFLENWRLAILVVMLTPLSVLLSVKIASASEAHFEHRFSQSGKLTSLVEESFSNYPTTKAYNLEEYTAQRHDAINEKLKKASAKASFMSSIVQPLIQLTNAIAYILISLVGGWLIVEKGIGVGVVVAVVLYARQFSSPLEELAYGFGRINQVKAASKRVFAILDMEEETEPAPTGKREPKGYVEFEDMSFSYKQEEPLLEKVNITVKSGQSVAIVGPTGAGKTTIVNLLMRFYDPDTGAIRLDGVDTKELPREQVRGQFGMVLQDTWLFRGTIFENVAYGKPDATREEVEEACRKAYCDHFIRTMPQGYDTLIGEDTTNLSGGQKQLLTIARALLADRPLLILDEATSNVDTRTEILIQKAMDKLMRGRTSFVIAHRLSTIVGSDLILVLDHGHIIEQGTHQQLLAQKGFYYQLYTSQYAV